MDFGATAVSFENHPRDAGSIVGARVGYGINRILTPYLGIYEADVDARELDAFDEVTMGHVDFGVRLHLADSRRRWIPYADIALTLWPVSDVLEDGKQTTTDFSGLPTFSLGGGLAIYLSEAWALDVDFKWAMGHFKDVPVGNIAAGETSEHVHTFLDIDANSARLTVGFSWWP